jgi:hypothetical protein
VSLLLIINSEYNFYVGKLRKIGHVPNTKIKLLVLLWSMLAIWTLGTPFGGVADEPQYLRNGIHYTLTSLNSSQTTIPAASANNIDFAACFAFHPEISALCQAPSKALGLVPSEPPKFLFSYPQPWFWLTSWPAILIQGENGPLFARLVAGMLSMGAISIGILLWKRDTKLLWMATIMAVNPLSISILAGYNPNSMEIAGSLSIALMLFGKASPLVLKRENFPLIISLLVVSLLTASAKPMSGTFVLFALILYFIHEMWISPKKINADKKQVNQPMNFTEIPMLVFIGGISIALSIYLSIGAFGVASEATQNSPLYRQYWASTLRFLGLSHNYALEYAGLFGWRDTTPAPWMQIFWILLFAACIVFIFLKQEIFLQRYLFLLWTVVFLLLPLMQTLLLAGTANVGLQTRYLAGYFCIVAVYSATLTKQINSPTLNRMIRGFVLLLLVNQLWVFVRFAIGLPGGYIPDLSNLLNGNFWRPYFEGAYFLIVLSLVFVVLNPRSNFLEAKK